MTPEHRERDRQKSREWRANNREQHRADVAAWRKANPEKYQAGLARRRARYAADAELRNRMRAQNTDNYHRKQAGTAEHRAAVKAARAEQLRIERAQKAAARAERQRERSRAWRAANPGRMSVLVRDWKKRNRAKVRADHRARRIAKRKATIAYLMTLQHGACAYCRCDLGGIAIHIDHILPRALGGSNERKNLQLTCEPCNLRKNATPPEKFILQFGRLI